jgi:hypothetical protein
VVCQESVVEYSWQRSRAVCIADGCDCVLQSRSSGIEWIERRGQMKGSQVEVGDRAPLPSTCQ